MMTTFRKKQHDTPQKLANSFEKCEAYWKRKSINFNFRGVKFILDAYGITFGQLRVAQFTGERGPYYCPEEAAYYLIQSGLISSKKVAATDIETLEEETYKLIHEWMTHCGSLSILYLIIVKQLEERHFFTSGVELEMMTNTKELSDSLQNAVSTLTQSTLTALIQRNHLTGIILQGKPIKNFEQMNEQH